MRIHSSPLHRDKKEGILLNEVFGVGKLSSYTLASQQPELASAAEVRNSPAQPSERRPRAVRPIL